MNADDLKKEPTERTYHLKCKCLVKQIHVKDVNAQGGEIQFDRTVVYLIPEKTDYGVAFLNAWLPDPNDSSPYYEIAMYLKPPVDSPARGAVSRKNQNCSEHHIFVMSKGVEDLIVNGDFNDKTILVDVFGENDEEVADHARDAEGEYDVIGKGFNE